MIAAVYVRVSTDEQAQHGVSLAGQLAACTERAAELAGNARAFGGGLLSYEALDSVNKPLMAERARLQAALDAQASDPGDSVADAARALGKSGLLRLVRESDADAQLAFLSVLFDRVEVLPGRVLRVVHSGGVLPDVELELGARE
jgi:hypothetical protein